MSDIVTLQIGNQRIENFVSYDIGADLYQAADTFQLELANPEAPVKAGMQCKLFINNQLELTGLIDKTARKGSKSGRTLTVEGRDLMGLLVDSHAEQFVTVQGKTVKQLAEMLLKTVPFIQRSQIVYQENVVGKLKGKKKTADNPLTAFMDTPQKFSQIEPGMSVFEVLAVYAASRGLMFFALPDGTLVFGRPKITGAPLFNVTNRLDGQGNNIESWDETDDISRRYSKVTVVSQVQGMQDFGMDTSKVNVKKSITDPGFPFYKPLVVKLNNDSQTPALYGRMLLEKQKHDGYSLAYTAPMHSQGGTNWAINELCTVNDEVLDVKRTLLVFNRRFRKTKQGSWTDIKLGPPGLVVASS
jgi:prophage tail gpP-like protein